MKKNKKNKINHLNFLDIEDLIYQNKSENKYLLLFLLSTNFFITKIPLVILFFLTIFKKTFSLTFNTTFNITFDTSKLILSQDFPPIKVGTVRVFVTHCKEPNKVPIFHNAEITLARCDAIKGSICGEAPFMLDFLYNWYDNLTEETIIFSHGHTTSWHIPNITESVDNARDTDYFKEQPYGGFPEASWKWSCDYYEYQEMYSIFFDNTTMPRIWTRFGIYPCCATFFVKTEQIRKREKEEYLTILKNVENWALINPKKPAQCGRLFEFVWHLLLTNKTEIPRPRENVTYVFSNTKHKYPCKYGENSTPYHPQ